MTDERIKYVTEIGNSGYDEISIYKQCILTDLLSDSDILEVLNNPNLSLDSPEDFFNVNIFSYLKIPNTQSVVKNFICFEVDDIDTVPSNAGMISKQITFRAVSHEEDIETPWGVNRQDLLAALIKQRYSWTNIMGNHFKKTYDVAYITENGYYYRTLRYHAITTNDWSNARMKNPIDRDRSKYDRRSR